MEVIGYLEHVDIPHIELFGLDAKIDTGADNCALHCDDIEIHKESVTFTLHDEVHPAYHGKRITMPIHKISKIKSSNGQVQKRCVIKTPLKLGCKSYDALISLTNRENMKYPLLIGRHFLSHHYLVDVSKKYMTKDKK